MVALECALEIISSEITQQADDHFDFHGDVPINNQSQDMVLHYMRNWSFLVNISLMSREMSRVVFIFSRYNFMCNAQYERNISWHSFLAAMQNKVVIEMAPGEADRFIR
jgi:hypothetical protein